jgi:hypothetical protein
VEIEFFFLNNEKELFDALKNKEQIVALNVIIVKT